MGLFTPDVDTLREVYTTQLQQALSMEKQIVDNLPKMIEKSSTPQLASAFRQHLEESQVHVSRLEGILNENTGEVDSTRCKAMASILSEGEVLIGAAGNESVRDVILIAAANQVEHHEMSVYGTLRNWAMVLGETAHAQLLEKTLEEEKNTDKILNRLSEQINVAAPVA